MNRPRVYIIETLSRDGGTGRRSGLKIRRGQPRGGSTPPPGTKILKSLYAKWPLRARGHFMLVAVLVAVACCCVEAWLFYLLCGLQGNAESDIPRIPRA